MFKSIVWATDGSAAADRSLPFVKSLATENNAEVLIVHADQLIIGRGGGQHVIADEEDVRAKIERQAKELRDAGINSTERIVQVAIGEGPAQTIAEAAKDIHADLIVVGTRGHTHLGGLLVGSITTRLLHIAPCPLFVVPTNKDAAASDAEAEGEAAHATT
ncbi:MAG TPA: universal stress protein [Thermoleophilaceae bacterium]